MKASQLTTKDHRYCVSSESMPPARVVHDLDAAKLRLTYVRPMGHRVALPSAAQRLLLIFGLQLHETIGDWLTTPITSGARETLESAKTRGSNLELMGGKAEHLVLLGPCGGQVGEAGNAHAMRKPTVNRRFDEIGREERKRDRHIDLTDAAPLAFGNSFGRGLDVSCKFIEPPASASS
jgi:hypothetical protein